MALHAHSLHTCISLYIWTTLKRALGTTFFTGKHTQKAVFHIMHAQSIHWSNSNWVKFTQLQQESQAQNTHRRHPNTSVLVWHLTKTQEQTNKDARSSWHLGHVSSLRARGEHTPSIFTYWFHLLFFCWRSLSMIPCKEEGTYTYLEYTWKNNSKLDGPVTSTCR